MAITFIILTIKVAIMILNYFINTHNLLYIMYIQLTNVFVYIKYIFIFQNVFVILMRHVLYTDFQSFWIKNVNWNLTLHSGTLNHPSSRDSNCYTMTVPSTNLIYTVHMWNLIGLPKLKALLTKIYAFLILIIANFQKKFQSNLKQKDYIKVHKIQKTNL